jgi:cytosine/adenosine deaminase-related metal-dependent hydrolase
MLTGTTALATLVAASREALAQQTVSRSAAAPGAPLPPRHEFVIRGANVLSMDPNIGDFAAGDVHVRDGAIVAVVPRIDRTNVQIIEAGNMICMPGFVDTHWHLWTSLLRPFIRADVDELGYFPVSFRLGQLFTPEDSYRSVLLGLAEALSAGHDWPCPRETRLDAGRRSAHARHLLAQHWRNEHRRRDARDAHG